MPITQSYGYLMIPWRIPGWGFGEFYIVLCAFISMSFGGLHYSGYLWLSNHPGQGISTSGCSSTKLGQDGESHESYKQRLWSTDFCVAASTSNWPQLTQSNSKVAQTSRKSSGARSQADFPYDAGRAGFLRRAMGQKRKHHKNRWNRKRHESSRFCQAIS